MKTRQLSCIPWPTGKRKSKRIQLPWINNAKAAEKTKGMGQKEGYEEDSVVLARQQSEASLVDRQKANRERQLTGRQAEDLARQYLIDQGLAFVANNYRCRCGELDLVMSAGDLAVVVEVRARGRTRFADAKASIDGRKRQRISRCSLIWWTRDGNRLFKGMRFDVVAVRDGVIEEWIRNAWMLTE